MEEEEQVVDATMSDEELELDLEPEAEPIEETVPKSQYAQVLARAKAAESKLKASTLSKPEQDISLEKDVKELKVAEKKRQFGYQHELSPEETDRLFRFAGNGDPEETLKDPFFQAGLKESRREARVKDATPSSSSRASKVDGKTFADMTSEERKKNWGKIVGK
jgi:hypothetical protein